MTDTIRTLTVVLEHDMRDEEDSVGQVIHAIEMMRCVAEVIQGPPVDWGACVARIDFRANYGRTIADVATSTDAAFHQEIRTGSGLRQGLKSLLSLNIA